MIGQLLPMLVAVITIPVLVRWLGTDRFGVLSLSWIVIGYFSLFDLGIGRALTKLIADKLGANEEQEIPPLAWTSLFLMLLLGLLGGIVLAIMTPWLVRAALKVPAVIQKETALSFHLLALSIPMVTLTSGLRGILEAQQQFRILNLIRIPMSIFSFAGPLVLLPFKPNLAAVVAVLVAGRLVGGIAHLLACFHTAPAMRHKISLKRSVVSPVLTFGGWMTVSNIIGPFLVYMDRFVVGALISMSAITYYTAPFDMVARIWVVPGAIVTVLFPAFAVSMVQQPDRTALLLRRGSKYVLIAVFPIVLIIIAFAPEGLRLWLGSSFAEKGTTVLRWLAAGIFVNSFAQVPFALVQSAGRPDVTAMLHLIELPIYGGGLWLLTSKMGIQGTAIAWTGRILLDTLLICFCVSYLHPRNSRFLLRIGMALTAALAVFCLVLIPENVVIRAGLVGVIMLGFASGSWFLMFAPEERAFLSGGRGKVTVKPQKL